MTVCDGYITFMGSGIFTYMKTIFSKKKQPNAGVDIPYMDHMGLRIELVFATNRCLKYP